MVAVLLISAMIIGAISLGIYARAHGKLGRCVLCIVLLCNPITGPWCLGLLVLLLAVGVARDAGLAEWVAGKDGTRL